MEYLIFLLGKRLLKWRFQNLSNPLRRFRLPYCIQIIIKMKSFKTLNLIFLRRPLPFDFWKFYTSVSIENGQAQWQYSVVVSPQHEPTCNYHRLKALGKLAEGKDQRLLEIRHLYLWNQELTHLPTELAFIENLERLEIWNNPIQEIPSSFQRLIHLKDIILSKDQQHLVPSIQKYLSQTTIGWV